MLVRHARACCYERSNISTTTRRRREKQHEQKRNQNTRLREPNPNIVLHELVRATEVGDTGQILQDTLTTAHGNTYVNIGRKMSRKERYGQTKAIS